MGRLIELCKTILIVLLTCSLLLLFMAAIPMDTIRDVPWLSRLVRPMAPLLGLSQAELTYVQAEIYNGDILELMEDGGDTVWKNF